MKVAAKLLFPVCPGCSNGMSNVHVHIVYMYTYVHTCVHVRMYCMYVRMYVHALYALYAHV